MTLKNIGVTLIMLGGVGLIALAHNTPLWYASSAIALIGFGLMALGDKKDKNGKK